ncbi:ABC transporter permease [Arthrobacter oryzae]|uniref:ABC-type spermidine/putrescine transport system permease subunit I n=1 Tax=Arthrobacter oryzae TaxID=409290 RepID=A0A495EU49_9MICC|nr:ABC transporter permease [Arthrobacter oryzae]RKR20099.1 ABC-type spermidine/putrescine transport system permease subunit I [Arthrobacter oryzae]
MIPALPAGLLLTGFFLVPIGFIIFYSFGYKPGLLSSIGVDRLSLDRYGEALNDTFLLTFGNTLQIALLGTALCLFIAYPFAYWLSHHVASRYRSTLLAVVLVPLWTNFLLRTIGWQIILSGDGWLSKALMSAGIIHQPLNILFTRDAVEIGVVYNYLIFMILPLYVVLERMDPSLRQASRDLGAGRLRTFLQVTFPLSMPGVVAGCLLVFVPLCGDYITASILGGASANMAGQLVAAQFLMAQNWALGSATAVVLIIAIIMTVLAAGAGLAIVTAVLRAHRSVTLPGAVN